MIRITDAAGNKLDGNGDGVHGGNWVGDFVVVPKQRPLHQPDHHL